MAVSHTSCVLKEKARTSVMEEEDDYEVIDVSMADDDIISVTCDDDLEDDNLESELREKFIIERKIKQEKIDDYPDYDVITTHLPGSNTSPSCPSDSQTPRSKDFLIKKDAEKQSISGADARKSGIASSEPKVGVSKEIARDKDPKSDGSLLKSKGSDSDKGSSRCDSSKKSTAKHSSKSDDRRVDETDSRKRKQESVRSGQRKKIFVPKAEARTRAPALEEFLWRKMRRIQQQNRQLFQLVEKLSAQLNERSSLVQETSNPVQGDRFQTAHHLAQGSFQNVERLPAHSTTYPIPLNHVSYRNPVYHTQTHDVSNRIIHRQQALEAQERAVYSRQHDEYLALGHDSVRGHEGLREIAERFSSVVPTYKEEYHDPYGSNIHSTVRGDTLAYPSDHSVNQVQVVRNQMVQNHSRLEGRIARRILERETALQHQQEQHRSLESSYNENYNRTNQEGLYHEVPELQRFETPQQRNIVVQPRSVVDNFEFDGQNAQVMGGMMHEERVVRNRPVLCHNERYGHGPLSMGAESMAHVAQMTHSRDRRQVEYERGRLCPMDVRSVEVGSNFGSFNQLAADSLHQNWYWQGGQFFDRRS